MESFPIQFCRAVKSYWRRGRRYQRLGGGKTTVKVARLGGGSSPRRAVKLRRAFRMRLKMPSPVGFFTRLRDAYVEAMLGIAGKGSGLSASLGPEVLLNRRIPKARPAKLKPGEFDRQLLIELCRSIRASREFSVGEFSK